MLNATDPFPLSYAAIVAGMMLWPLLAVGLALALLAWLDSIDLREPWDVRRLQMEQDGLLKRPADHPADQESV